MAFTRETDDDDWTASINIADDTYGFSIRSCYELHELNDIALRAKEYLELHWQQILDQVTDELLPMHNEEWSDDNDHPLSDLEFRSALGKPDINVWEEEAIMIYIADGGMFGGHYIEVFIEGPDYGREISIGIVG